MAKVNTKKEKEQATEAVGLKELQELTEVRVKFTGLTAIMFDRFVSMEGEELPPEKKLYLREEGKRKRVILPSGNIMSFLAGEKKSCCAFFAKKGEGAKIRQMIWGAVAIRPDEIPFTRDGKPAYFKGFGEGTGFRIDERKAIVKKGGQLIPQPTIRPVMELPWELEFDLTLWGNDLKFRFFPEEGRTLANWFIRGGLMVAIGNFRPHFGRFTAEFKEI